MPTLHPANALKICRVLAELQDLAVVGFDQRHMVIADLAALRRLAAMQ